MKGEDSEDDDEGMEVEKEHSDKSEDKSMKNDDQDGKDEDTIILQHTWEMLPYLFLQLFSRQLLHLS